MKNLLPKFLPEGLHARPGCAAVRAAEEEQGTGCSGSLTSRRIRASPSTGHSVSAADVAVRPKLRRLSGRGAIGIFVAIYCALLFLLDDGSRFDIWGAIAIRSAEARQAKPAPNYYEVLGVARTATMSEIKKKYRQLSKQYHPDVNKEDASAKEKFTNVAEAYEVLSNPEERQLFDRLGAMEYQNQKGTRGGGGGGGSDEFWGDFPFSFFGGGGQRRRGREKAPSIRMRFYVTLEQLYFGDLLHVKFRRPVLCMHVEDCLAWKAECVGEGMKVVQQQVGPGFIVQNHVQDNNCVAKNKGWKKNCPKCPKGPTEMDNTFLSAYVEPGMKHGEKLEFLGVGTQMLNHDTGDLILDIVELHNELNMVRRGNDLHTDLSLTLLESLVGFQKTVKHISGKEIPIARSIVTADSEVQPLRGRGMPVAGKEGEFGDLFVTLKVNFPVELDEAQKAKIREALGGVRKWKYAVKVKIDDRAPTEEARTDEDDED